MYAAGKIPGGFFKREGRATEQAIAHRADDRPPDPAALAEGLPQRGAGHLHRSLGRPRDAARHPLHQRRVGGAHASRRCRSFGPIGAVRVGRVDDEFVLNPTLRSSSRSRRSTSSSSARAEALTMVEAGGDQIPEDTILEALELAHAEIRKICDGARRSFAPRSARRSGSTSSLTAELDASARRRRSLGDRRARRSSEAGTVVEELVESSRPPCR